MAIEKFLIGVAIFTAFMIGGSMIYGNVIDTYDVNTTIDDTGINEKVYNRINETYTLSKEIEQDVFEGDVDSGDESWATMIAGGYKAIRKTFTMASSSLSMAGEILESIGEELHIPPFLISLALYSLIITLVFGAIYMFFRFKG